MYSAEQFATATAAAEEAYQALLAYYANERKAAGHIVSLLATNNSNSLNDTESGSGSGSELASNFYVGTRLDESQQSTMATSSAVGSGGASSSGGATEMPVWLIPSYSVILLFAVLGNLLVISTLVQNRRMRTITNLFLLNLAISDMLLGVLCMPATLVGTLLRNFIFGEFLCKLIPFSQAASVAVSSWTLVAISCERYYAICHPLRSRSWQTISHAYRIIGFIWLGGILCMTPIAVFSQLIPTSRPGYCKCREHWPDQGYERMYNILLDLILLVLPLIILCVAYILITRTLYVGMANNSSPKANEAANCNQSQLLSQSQSQSTATCSGGSGAQGARPVALATCLLVMDAGDYNGKASRDELSNNNKSDTTTTTTTRVTATTTTTTSTTSTTVALVKSSPSLRGHDAALRRSNEAKTLESKKRVVKMLFVLVLEFFICWTPLYVINTLGMFIGPALYEYIDYTSISYLQLLAYSSSCCNPITYCFMNAGFRRAFVDTFKGLPWRRGRSARSGAAPSGMTGTWQRRSRSHHEMVSLSLGVNAGNSIVQTGSGAGLASSPRL